MFRHKISSSTGIERYGAQVEALALVTLYEARGDYQLNVETLAGPVWGLFEAFEQLRTSWKKPDCFDPAQSEIFPFLPNQSGLSRLLASRITRRAHHIETPHADAAVIIYPTPYRQNAALHSGGDYVRIRPARMRYSDSLPRWRQY